MHRGSEPISVAVKTAKKSTTEKDKVEFLREMNIMSKMVHPNIVQLYGIIREGNNHLCLQINTLESARPNLVQVFIISNYSILYYVWASCPGVPLHPDYSMTYFLLA